MFCCLSYFYRNKIRLFTFFSIFLNQDSGAEDHHPVKEKTSPRHYENLNRGGGGVRFPNEPVVIIDSESKQVSNFWWKLISCGLEDRLVIKGLNASKCQLEEPLP